VRQKYKFHKCWNVTNPTHKAIIFNVVTFKWDYFGI
jgi:hypothetical protein